MVTQRYDFFGRLETPELTLCNPNGDELYSLKVAYDIKSSIRYNAVSEISFVIPKSANGVEIPAYPLVKQKRTIKTNSPDLGSFIIVSAPEDESAEVPIKTVTAYSLEYELSNKRLSAFGGTYPLYDPLDVDNSLLGKMISYAPTWSIGSVDGDLLGKFRTFDVADTNVYNFLMTDVEEAFGCIFTFDTWNKEIIVTAIANATSGTDVFMSHQNLISSSTLKEIENELVTALNVYGAGGLDIRTVNPLGTTTIYDYSYFKSSDWMSSELVSALTTWEELIETQQSEYADTLTSLKITIGEKIVLQGQLSDLETSYSVLDTLLQTAVEAGTIDLSDLNSDIADKQVEIDSKELEISGKQTEIDGYQAVLTGINESVSFEANFSEELLLELSNYTYESTWTNENLAQLDSMGADEVQELGQELYAQGIEILGRISQPRYEFSVDAASFLALEEFEYFTDQIDLGAEVYVQNKSEELFTLVLLEINLNYEKPDEFSLVFSNRLRLDGAGYIYSDLFGQTVKAGSSVKSNKLEWGSWSRDSKDTVTEFITSSLDATVNEIINGSNQEIRIYENGLRGREYNPLTDEYGDNQVWLTSNVLAFTNDGWDSAALALGRITHDGSDVYGLVASSVFGTLLAGNELRIANEDNNFVLDQNGAVLTNASFTLQRDDGKSRIVLDPDAGIEIYSNPSGTEKRTFYADSLGNLIFTGNLKGASGDFSGKITANEGSIGGISITSNGLDLSASRYIHSDGEIKWGGLWLKANGDAIFEGTVSADRLDGDISWNQIVDAPIPTTKFNTGSGYSAGAITAGTMSGSRIFGGSLGGNGVSIGLGTTGVPTISGTNKIVMDGGTSFMELGTGYSTFTTSGSMELSGSSLNMYFSSITVSGSPGLDRYIYYKDWSDTSRYLRFSRGILIFAS